VGGDAYELRIVPDGRERVLAAEVSPADMSAGVKATLASDGNLIRATIKSPTSREISWKIKIE
jgi:hypothetical protein